MVFHASVAQRLVERLVAVGQINVLAHHGDADFAFGVLGLVHQIVPALEFCGRRVQAQLVANQAVQALLVQHARHFVDGVHVPHGDHAPHRYIGEQRDFLPFFVRNRAVGAAHQRVGLDADFAQLLGGVLGGFGLEFASRSNPGHVAQMHKSGVVRAQLQAHLAHGFQKRQGLDVAHGAANFHNGHVHRIGLAQARAALDEFLDFIGNVRDHLHRFAQIVAPTLFVEHAFVDLAGGEIIGLAHAGFHKALVVAQVEVGLGAVVGDEHLAVLQGRHGARVDVEIGIEFDQGDCQTPRFQERGE